MTQISRSTSDALTLHIDEERLEAYAHRRARLVTRRHNRREVDWRKRWRVAAAAGGFVAFALGMRWPMASPEEFDRASLAHRQAASGENERAPQPQAARDPRQFAARSTSWVQH
jgi:hypothetical protein